MTNTYYGIDDGHGNQLTTGLQEHDARQTAVRLAAELRQAVYLYEVGSQEEPEAIAPADEDDLVLCESPDGWSLHAPGSTDEEDR